MWNWEYAENIFLFKKKIIYDWLLEIWGKKYKKKKRKSKRKKKETVHIYIYIILNIFFIYFNCLH